MKEELPWNKNRMLFFRNSININNLLKTRSLLGEIKTLTGWKDNIGGISSYSHPPQSKHT